MTIAKQTARGEVIDTPSSRSVGITAPVHAHGGFGNAAALTPDDVTDFANELVSVYVGGTGNVATVLPDSTVVTFENVPAGTFLPLRCRRINATGTTATMLVGLW